MIVERGNIWAVLNREGEHIIFIPTNSMINQEGLVMGAGLAYQAQRHFPFLSIQAGRAICAQLGIPAPETTDVVPDYHALILQAPVKTSSYNTIHLGLVQTKRNWKYNTPPLLLHQSINAMLDVSRIHPQSTIHSVLPGTGLGGLQYSAVHQIFEESEHEAIERLHLWYPK